MSYPIEVLAVKEELYKPIQSACDALNQVQKEFIFDVPSSNYRSSAFLQERPKYASADLFNFLREYRNNAGGNRPHVILVVDGILSSEKTENLFGITSMKEGLAIFTIHEFDQFLHDIVRYCRYYLVNFAIRFFEPAIKSHEETRACLFDFKREKKVITLSLNSGKLCDECLGLINSSARMNLDIRDAISKLHQIVSNQHPLSIVMKGGGVKGLALAGALLELEKHFSFDAFAGTSAGAIAAVLLGAEYKPSELLAELRDKDFNDFRDASLIEKLKHLRYNRWLYPGLTVESWIRGLLRKKISLAREIEMQDLPLRTLIYASREKEATMLFDSHGKRRDTHAHFAARCSMAIPYYFSPEIVDGVEVYDGGIRNNFPLAAFIEDNKSKPFLGLYIKATPGKSTAFGRVLSGILRGLGLDSLGAIVLEGDEPLLLDKYPDKIIVIDVHTIGMTDFDLSPTKKDFLEVAGRLAALRFLETHYPDILLDKNYISQMSTRYEALKTSI